MAKSVKSQQIDNRTKVGGVAGFIQTVLGKDGTNRQTNAGSIHKMRIREMYLWWGLCLSLIHI